MTTGRTGAVVNSHEIVTGDFTRDTEFRIPGEGPRAGAAGAAAGGLSLFDASELARKLLGDTIYTNMMLFGRGLAAGLIPLSREAILQAVAIELNGAAVERNKQAFEMGRWAIVNPEAAERLIAAEVVEKPKTLDEKIAFRADHLTAYQGKRLAKRYRKLVDSVIRSAPQGGGGQGLSQAAEPTRTNTRSRACTWRPRPRRGRSSTAISN
jgi:indolepyruvate ferredoxin oxidoreductase